MCSRCGHRSASRYDKRRCRVRDLSVAGWRLHKVSLGLVEGLNNKIRLIQRSACGYRDEDYLRLKIIASFMPPLPEKSAKTLKS